MKTGYQKKLLSNGLRVIATPMPQVKSVTVLIMVEAGSRYENASNNGVSHFLEHMMFKGTKNRPNKLAISSLLDGIGGSFNAFTSKEYTGFYVKAAAEHLNLVMDVLSDVLINSLFSTAEIEKDRGVILEEINMYEDEPQSQVGELFEESIFDGSPLAMRILGTKENIARMERKTVVQYFNKMYHSGSMVIGLSGLLPENYLEVAEKYFGQVKGGQKNQFVPTNFIQTAPKTRIKFKDTDQAHVCVGVKGYELIHPDRYALDVLGTILGGNMSSRLFHEVREKRGLAYSIGAGSEEYHDSGYLVAQGGLRIPAVFDAIKVILEQFDLLTTELVSEKDLRRAKDYWKGKMILALEDSYRVASFYTSKELLRGKVETPEEVLEKVELVTAEDIRRVAKDIFISKHLNLSAIGPFKDEDKFAKLLEL